MGDEENLCFEIIRNIIVFHINKCNKSENYCDICKIAFLSKDDTKVNVIEYIQILFNSLNEQQNSQRAQEHYEVIHTFITIHSTHNNYFLLNMFYSQTILKLYSKFPVLVMNLLSHFKIFFSKNITDMNYVNYLMSIENESEKILKFIEHLNSIVINQKTSYEFLISSAKLLYKLKKSINKKILDKLENKLNYQLIILRFILETSVNKKSKLKGNSQFNIAYFEDFLNDRYENDNFFVMKYSFDEKELKILRTSREYSSFVDSQFKMLFLFDDIVIKEIFTILKNISIADSTKMTCTPFTVRNKKGCLVINKNSTNQTILEYPIKDPKESGYINSFKMNFRVYPTINLKDFLIASVYHNKYNHVIMTLEDCNSYEEKVISFNYEMKEELIISPILLSQLNFSDKSILFNDIFTESENQISNQQAYKLDFNKYIPLIQDRMNHYYEKGKLSEKGKKEYSALVKKIKTRKIQNPIVYFYLILRKEYPLSFQKDKEIKIYYFQKSKILKKEKDKESDNYKKWLSERKTLKAIGKTHSIRQSKVTTTGLISNTSEQNGLNLSTIKIDSIQTNFEGIHGNNDNAFNKKKNIYTFSSLTILILILNLLLVLLTIAFLIMELQTNTIFYSTFLFFQSWNKFQRLFLSNTLSVFFSACPAMPKVNECKNEYGKISNEYDIKLEIDTRINLDMFIFEEIASKNKLYLTRFNEVKNQIYHTNEKTLINLMESTFSYTFLTIANNEIGYDIQETNYINALSIYHSLLNGIAESDLFTSTPVQFIIVTSDGIDFSAITELDNHSVKFNFYNIILNYCRLLSTLQDLSEEVGNCLLKDIQDCRFIGILFMCLLIVCHFILFGICLFSLGTYKHQLYIMCQDIFDKLANTNLNHGLKEKYEILKQLSCFYNINPNKLSVKYENLKSDFRQLLKGKDISSTQLLKNITLKINKEPKGQFKSVLLQSLTTIIYLFLAYIIFFFIYLIGFLIILNSYSNLISTFRINSKIDRNVYSMFTIIQLNLFTNQNDNDMLSLYNNDTNEIGFINYKVKETFNYLFEIEKEENLHSSGIIPFRDLMILNCDSMFPSLSDLVIKNMVTLYKERYNNDTIVYDTLAKICKGFNFTQYNNDKILINEILYRLMNINDQINNDYLGHYEMNTSKKLFDLYIIVLLLYRPLRNHESSEVYPRLIKNTTRHYNIVIYSFLVLNTIFEIMIFLMLKHFTIQNYIYTIKSLVLLTRCIKV